MTDAPSESRPLDDPLLLQAMRAHLRACDELAAAANDAEVLERSERKSMTGMALRKRLVEAGWSAPTRQRTST